MASDVATADLGRHLRWSTSTIAICTNRLRTSFGVRMREEIVARAVVHRILTAPDLGDLPQPPPMDRTDLAAAAIVTTIPLSDALDALTMPVLYSTALALGVVTTLGEAASLSLAPGLVPRHELLTAQHASPLAARSPTAPAATAPPRDRPRRRIPRPAAKLSPRRDPSPGPRRNHDPNRIFRAEHD